eukprot:SAG31_NODE_89_length_26711_cov_24.949459_21_plen_101_part_00
MNISDGVGAFAPHSTDDPTLTLRVIRLSICDGRGRKASCSSPTVLNLVGRGRSTPWPMPHAYEYLMDMHDIPYRDIRSSRYIDVVVVVVVVVVVDITKFS